MKTILRLLVGLGFAACVASVRAELSPIAFVVGSQQFQSGDAITIDQVLASSPSLEVGTRITVRGHYQVASSAKARLGLFVTHRGPAGTDRSDAAQVATVQTASGSFELSCEITYEGDPHVSFY